MSSSTPSIREAPIQGGSRVLRSLRETVQFVSFWSAIALPFLYTPLLVGGLTESQTLVFAALLVANAVAFVVGHDYKRTEA